MHLYRKTALVQFELFSGATESSLPLATERDFGVILSVEGSRTRLRIFALRSTMSSGVSSIGGCAIATPIAIPQTIARRLPFAAWLTISTQAWWRSARLLRDFLGRTGDPRRLVIQTTRPELHLLPWAAMIDDTGAFLAAGDLSVVHSWANFTLMESTTGNTLQLMTVLGTDTNQVTAASLQGLPKEIQTVDGTQAFQAGTQGRECRHSASGRTRQRGDQRDRRCVRNRAGQYVCRVCPSRCCGVVVPGAANSWGESPALCLHRQGAGFVLSFLAELHNQDAQSISTAFYREVFGPAASRDPETALVRIRADKFANEFPFANWASMTVYMRNPLDLSALPLNGPRVPQAQWAVERCFRSRRCMRLSRCVSHRDRGREPPRCTPSRRVADASAASAAPADQFGSPVCRRFVDYAWQAL